MGSSFGRYLPGWARVALGALVAWDLVWKGLALWQAARRRQPAWFVVLLVANTAGILPITYLALMRRRDASEAAQAGEGETQDAAGAPSAEPEAERHAL